MSALDRLLLTMPGEKLPFNQDRIRRRVGMEKKSFHCVILCTFVRVGIAKLWENDILDHSNITESKRGWGAHKIIVDKRREGRSSQDY